jgi:hypothetical protein
MRTLPVQLAVIVVSMASLVLPARSQQNAEQIVFSGGRAFTYTNVSPGTNACGFWIWCEPADASNPYHGQCNGALYFYDLGITKHVAGGVTEITEGVYQMSVVSTVDDTIACTLTNTAPAQKGPKNTVSVTCTAPAGTGMSTTAVVNVTGKS